MKGRRRHPTWLLFAAVALAVIVLIGRGLAPMLLTKSPLLLVVLSPTPEHLLLAARVSPMVPFLVVGTCRRLLAPILGYYIGRHYGPEGVAFLHKRYPRWSRLLGFVERAFDRAAPLLLLALPLPGVSALAGARLFNPLVALVMVTAGQAIRVALIFQVSDALSAWLTPIVEFLGANVWSATLVCALLAIAYGFSRRRSQKRMIDTLEHMEEGERGDVPPHRPAGSER